MFYLSSTHCVQSTLLTLVYITHELEMISDPTPPRVGYTSAANDYGVWGIKDDALQVMSNRFSV